MIQDRPYDFRSQDIKAHTPSHYSDADGNLYLTDPDKQYDPQPLTLTLKDGRTKDLYLVNNPRQVLDGIDIIFQYCVFCKDMRFETESFRGNQDKFQTTEKYFRRMDGPSLLFSCENPSCFKDKMNDFINNYDMQKFKSIFRWNAIDKLQETIANEKK